jgi:hypothetical protein
MDDETIKEVLKQLNSLNDFHSNTSSYFHNAPYTVTKCRELLFYMKAKLPVLYKETKEYIEKHRNEIYVKSYVMRGWELYADLYGNLRFFQESLVHKFEDDWMTSLLDSGDNYTNAEYASQKVRDVHDKHEISHCDLEDILKVHRDKPCQDNGWFCDMCDTMEHLWHRYLVEKLHDERNIFLNKTMRDGFIEKKVKEVNVPLTWYPEIQKREGERLDFTTDGKTATQIMYLIVGYAKWAFFVSESYEKDEWKKICKRWSFVNSIKDHINILEDACNRVESMYM